MGSDGESDQASGTSSDEVQSPTGVCLRNRIHRRISMEVRCSCRSTHVLHTHTHPAVTATARTAASASEPRVNPSLSPLPLLWSSPSSFPPPWCQNRCCGGKEGRSYPPLGALDIWASWQWLHFPQDLTVVTVCSVTSVFVKVKSTTCLESKSLLVII